MDGKLEYLMMSGHMLYRSRVCQHAFNRRRKTLEPCLFVDTNEKRYVLTQTLPSKRQTTICDRRKQRITCLSQLIKVTAFLLICTLESFRDMLHFTTPACCVFFLLKQHSCSSCWCCRYYLSMKTMQGYSLFYFTSPWQLRTTFIHTQCNRASLVVMRHH